MKIKVIFTGGTIGSSVGSDGYISPNGNQPYKLLEMYKQAYNRTVAETDVVFDTEEPYRILSENLDAKHENLLIQTVAKALQDKETEGIIITHGTDTLQYSAAILGYVFGTKTVPIVLVSSDFPLEDARANGVINFAHAVDVIKYRRGTGVFVSYCNVEQYPVIHRATKLLAHPQYSADVESVRYQNFGMYFEDEEETEKDTFLPNEAYHEPEGAYCNLGSLSEDTSLPQLSEDGSGILWVRPYVGMTYPQLTEKHQAVLLDSYHSGTIRISEDLSRFMKEAVEREIPVFLTGIIAEEHAYETVGAYEELGIIVLPEISNIAAYCKLWLAISNHMELVKTMKACVAEDYQ